MVNRRPALAFASTLTCTLTDSRGTSDGGTTQTHCILWTNLRPRPQDTLGGGFGMSIWRRGGSGDSSRILGCVLVDPIRVDNSGCIGRDLGLVQRCSLKSAGRDEEP